MESRKKLLAFLSITPLPDVAANRALGIASAALQAGLDNVETVEAEMEAIPFPIDSVDHVISNGTINLSRRASSASSPSALVSFGREGRSPSPTLTRIHERQPLGIGDLALYLLFTPDVLALMRRQIPPRRSAKSGSPS